jgi:hypothetical protein
VVAVEADLTVRVSGAMATIDPERPLTVNVAVPGPAVLLAVSFNVLLLVAGFGVNDAEMPDGRSETDKFTLPLNPNCGITMMVEFRVVPGLRLISLGASEIPKFGALIVSVIGIDALRLPEVPIIVTVAVPGVALPLVVNVTIVELVAGLGVKVAVTPEGRFAVEKFTFPLNPYWPDMEIVDVTELLSLTIKLLGLA